MVKNKIVIFGLVVGFLVFLAACESAKSPVSALVDGVEWNADESVVASKLSSSVLINAIALQNPPITLQIYSLNEPGNYALDGSNNFLLYGEDKFSGYSAKPSNPGTLAIIEHNTEDKHIIGTFSCFAYNANGDSIHITDGQFDIFYIE